MVAEKIPAQVACRVLAVSESGYYARLRRAPSERAVRHAWLTEVITQVHIDSRGTYGGRRVHAELTLGQGITVGHWIAPGSVESGLCRPGGCRGAGVFSVEQVFVLDGWDVAAV